jgi:hypothetical protein
MVGSSEGSCSASDSHISERRYHRETEARPFGRPFPYVMVPTRELPFTGPINHATLGIPTDVLRLP